MTRLFSRPNQRYTSYETEYIKSLISENPDKELIDIYHILRSSGFRRTFSSFKNWISRHI